MNKTYNPVKIESKWQKVWEENNLYQTPDLSANPSTALRARRQLSKRYVLDMFPYPSGATMHVGHLEGYVGTDIISRYLRMRGFAVLHPMGWDAFGLPAENYAIKTGIAPNEETHKNIATFKRQLINSGLSYDWSKEIDTSRPNYYKWTQWLFILFFKKGLAYKKRAPANYCPKDETVLANEQVVDGKCERCGTEVIQKDLDQWFFKITDYADRLVEGLTRIDWLDEVKRQQINWIGKKEGINIKYEVEQRAKGKEDRVKQYVEVFTTRPETNFGATFVVLAPEHPLALAIATPECKEKVAAYIEAAKKKKEIERINEGRKKTGVFTGAYAINQLNGVQMPIWISDFVLSSVGTGALVGVPGHDLRDFQFAKEFSLAIKRVVVGSDGELGEITKEDQVQEEKGVMINSEFLDGLEIHEATVKMMDYLEEKGWGKRVVTYHLRDWLISRQRYWGCPIPMIYCERCAKESEQGSRNREQSITRGWFPVPEEELPVLLPTDVDFRPHGESPIARSKTFQEGVKCPNCGGPGRREVDTMDTYVDSSWYFLAFPMAEVMNSDQGTGNSQKVGNIFDACSDEIKAWLPVDIYVGGGHVVQHLLFARFFYKVLYDAGYLPKDKGDEPFIKLRAPGWILGPDSRKMSKRWNNVITPDQVIEKYGADTLRVYEMFLGPFEAMKPWSVESVAGVYRFLTRINNLFENNNQNFSQSASEDLARAINQLIKRVEEDIEGMRFNTAVAGMMEFVNELSEFIVHSSSFMEEKVTLPTMNQELVPTMNLVWEKFLLVLAPFAPFLAEELWQRLKTDVISPSTSSGSWTSVHCQSWPEVDKKYLAQTEAVIAISINGKTRGTIKVSSEQGTVNSQIAIEELARKDEKVAKYLEGQKVKKVIYVPGKILNFVI